MDFCRVYHEIKAPTNRQFGAPEITGKIVFTPDLQKGEVWTVDGVVVPAMPIECEVIDGKMYDTRGEHPSRYVNLMAGGATSNPSAMHWRVSYHDMRVGKDHFYIEPFIFKAVPYTTVNLSDVTPVAGYTPPGIIRGGTGAPGLGIIFKGVVLTREDLPVDGVENNHAYAITTTKELAVWQGDSWTFIPNFAGIDVNLDDISDWHYEARKNVEFSREQLETMRELKEMAEKYAEAGYDYMKMSMTSADGKSSIFYGSEPPETAKEGDTWFKDTEDGSVIIMQYVDGKWVAQVDVDAMDKELADNAARVKDAQDAINTLTTETLPALRAELDNLDSVVALEIADKLATLEKKLSDADVALKQELKSELTALDGALNVELTGKLDDLKTALEKADADGAEAVATTLVELENRLKAADTAVKNELAKQLEDLEGDLAALGVTLGEDLTSKLAALKTELKEADAAVNSDLVGKLSTLRTELLAADTAVTGALRGELTALEDALKKADTAVKNDLQGKINTLNNTTLPGLKQELLSADTTLSNTLSKNLTDAETRLKAADTKVKTDLQGELTSLETALIAADSVVSQDLQKKLDDTRKALQDADAALTTTLSRNLEEARKTLKAASDTIAKDLAGVDLVVNNQRPGNLFPDPFFKHTCWGSRYNETDECLEVVANGVTNGAYYFPDGFNVYSHLLTLEPSASYLLTVDVRFLNGDELNRAIVYSRYLNSEGAWKSYVTGYIDRPADGSSWTTVSTVIKMSSSVASEVSLGFYVASQYTTGTVQLRNVRLSRAADEGLIVDGAVTASKVKAGVIDADHIAAGAIVATKLAANSVVAGKIAANAVVADSIAANQVTTAKIATNAVTANEIAAETILASNIKANAITTAKIAANAVTANEIAADSVIATKIKAGSVTTAAIAAGAVTANEIKSGTITAKEITSGTITSAEIAADTLTAGNIKAGAITATQLATNAVTAIKIAANAVTTVKIAANAVTANEIAAETILADNIKAGQITTAKIATNAVTANEIAADTILANNIKAGQITTAKIATNAVTANEIASETILATNIKANAITTAKIATNAVTANEIAADTILASNIKANQITTAKIATDAVTANEIAANAVTANAIKAGEVTAGKIAANAVTANEIASETILAGNIKANQITTAKIAANAVTANEIAADQVLAKHVKTDQILAKHVKSGEIKAEHLLAEEATINKLWTNGLVAKTIATSRLAVSTGNMFPDPNFEDPSWSVPVEGVTKFENGISLQGNGKQHGIYLQPEGKANAAMQHEPGVNYLMTAHLRFGGNANITKFSVYARMVRDTGVTGATKVGEFVRFPSGQDHASYRYMDNYTVLDFSSIKMAPGGYFTLGFFVESSEPSGGVDIMDVRLTKMSGTTLIEDGAITTGKVAANAITANEIATDAVTAKQIKAGQITSDHISTAKISSDKITVANGYIKTAMIGDSQITNAKIGSLDAGKITTGYLNAARIKAGDIKTVHIGANQITSNEIAAKAVKAEQIDANSITSDHLKVGTIKADRIEANVFTQVANSVLPLIPGTVTPTWTDGLRYVARSGTKDAELPAGIPGYYREPSGTIAAGASVTVNNTYRNVVSIDPNLEYEATWWVRSSSGSPRYMYVTLEDQNGNTDIVQKIDGADSDGTEYSKHTWGNPIRAIITPASTVWTKYSTIFTFKEGTKSVRINNVHFNNGGNSNASYLYIAGLEISPHIIPQRDVDARQDRAQADLQKRYDELINLFIGSMADLGSAIEDLREERHGTGFKDGVIYKDGNYAVCDSDWVGYVVITYISSTNRLNYNKYQVTGSDRRFSLPNSGYSQVEWHKSFGVAKTTNMSVGLTSVTPLKWFDLSTAIVATGAWRLNATVGWDAATNHNLYGVRILVNGSVVKIINPRDGLGPLLPVGDGYRTQTISASGNGNGRTTTIKVQAYTNASSNNSSSKVRRLTATLDWTQI